MLLAPLGTSACEQIPLNDVIPNVGPLGQGEVTSISTDEKSLDKKCAHLYIVYE